MGTLAFVSQLVLTLLICYGPVSTCTWTPLCNDFTGEWSSTNLHSTNLHSNLPSCAMVSFPKRAPWESSGNRAGLCLADCGELSLPTGAKCSELPNVPADQIHDSATGVSFATFMRFQELMHLRTVRPMAFILKGFVKQKLLTIGIEDSRIAQLVITLRDRVCSVDESRAVTLVNAATDETDFFCKTHDDSALDFQDENKLTVFFEIRESDASKADWKSYGSVAAFTLYVEALVKTAGIKDKSVLHKVVEKSGYFMRRVMIPFSARDFLYSKSGQNSVQIRAARRPFDPPEPGMEVLKTENIHDDLPSLAKSGEAVPGFLGVFSTQGSQYVRVADGHIAEARRHWFVNDSRFDEENIGMKATKHFRISGLPAGVNFPDILKVTRAFGWNVIPMRVFHINELAVAIVASDAEPNFTKVPTSLGTLLIAFEERRIRKQPGHKIEDINQGSNRHGEPDSNMSTSSQSSHPTTADSRGSLSNLPRTSLLPVPYAGLANRVQELEKQMTNVTKQIGTLEANQKETNSQIQGLQASQDNGFKNLMTAIQQLRDNTVSSGSPMKPASPPNKVLKK